MQTIWKILTRYVFALTFSDRIVVKSSVTLGSLVMAFWVILARYKITFELKETWK